MLGACGGAGAAGSTTSGQRSSGPGTTADPPTTASTTTTSTLARLHGPTTVLEIGDSLGEDLGLGLHDILANDSKVTLVQAAKGDTGLVEPQYYDWPAHLRDFLALDHPQVVVVFLGANDVQNFYQGNTLETFGTPGWKATYGARVATLMREATASGARVLWVGMPIMADPTFSSDMQVIDGVYQSEAASHPGVTYFSSWSLFSTASGVYTASTTGTSGQSILLRDSDGIHITIGLGSGSDYLARAVVTKMRSLYGLP